jgi:hypothetical protein
MKAVKYIIAALVSVLIWSGAQAEVVHRQINADNLLVKVSDDAWQPEGFENGTAVPATYVHMPNIVIDGNDAEAAWNQAVEVDVPLTHGGIGNASLKAVYTDDEVFIRVRWKDTTEDRQHLPWVWNPTQKQYVQGPQIEDSVLLSFEAGCEWEPSFMAGYIFDFDGWHWMAARSDPLGQAVDLYGNVQDQPLNPGLIRYESRVTQDTWNMKFTDNVNPRLTAGWENLDRVYMLQPHTDVIYVQKVPDGGRNVPEFVRQVAAPESAPYPRDEATTVPQYVPVELRGEAGEVKAKGQWADGYWTVEFRRVRITPAKTLNDTVFNRMVQFSVHVFDREEKLDGASESERLFLKFLPAGERLVSN